MRINFSFFLSLLIFLLFTQGNSFYAQNSDIDSLNRALNLANSDSSRASTCITLSKNWFYQNKDSCMLYAQKSLRYAEAAQDIAGQAEAHRIIGITFITRSASNLAMDHYLKAEELYREIGDSLGMGRTRLNIGTVYLEEKQYQKAIDFLSEGLAQNFYRGDPQNERFAIHNMGVCYDELGDNENAYSLFMSNLVVQDSLGEIYPLSLTLGSLGIVLTKMDSLEKAEEFLDWALELKKELKDDLGQANIYSSYGELELKRNNPTKALQYFQEANQIAIENQSHHLRTMTLHGIAKAENQLGRFENAFLIMDSLKTLEDSLNDSKGKELVANMQSAYELREKNSQIEQKQQFLEKQSSYISGLVISLVFLFIMMVVLVVLWISRQRKNKLLLEQKEKLEDQHEKIQSQFEALKQAHENLESIKSEQEGMMHMIAHDLKTPLNKSLMLAQLIEADAPVSDKQKELLGMIERVNLSGAELINDLLELSSAESKENKIELSPFDPKEVLKNCVGTISPGASQKSIRVETQIPDEEVQILSNQKALTRILENLLGNAVKFSPPNTQITTGIILSHSKVEIFVQDEGPGISPEDQEKLFGKFQRLSARPTGGESSSGLGLAIVKALSEKIGGQILVESELGRGTKFKLNLPK